MYNTSSKCEHKLIARRHDIPQIDIKHTWHSVYQQSAIVLSAIMLSDAFYFMIC
jgi:hypothetical protein